MTTATRSRARALGRGLAALAALVVLAIVLQPWWLAPVVSHQLSASARRPVHFDSMWLTLTRGLQPVLELRGVRIDNAPWADARRPFAVLSAAAAVFSWDSLRQRRPIIALMVLRDGEVDLERRADGLRNWRLGEPDYRGPGRFKVLAIQGDRAVVRFAHELLELELQATASPSVEHDRPGGDPSTSSSVGGAASASVLASASASTSASSSAGAAASVSGSASAAASTLSTARRAATEPMPTRLDIRGTWRGVPFVIDATTSEAITLAETGRMFRARGRIASGSARIDFDGRLGDIIRDPLFETRLAAATPSLAPFAAVLGPHRGEARAVALAGELKGAPGTYALAVESGRLGATDLAGELSWKRGEERDVARVRLNSDSASLADLRSLAGRRRAKEIERVAAKTTAPASASRRTSAGMDAARTASVPTSASRTASAGIETARTASAPAQAGSDEPGRHASAPGSGPQPAPRRPLDVELGFTARRLHAEGMPWVQSGAVDARLADGQLVVSRLDVGIAHGHAVGRGRIDVGATPMQGDAELDLDAVRIESFMPAQAAKHLLSGTLHGRVALKASGDSAEALLTSATGRVSAFVASGSISSLLDAEVGLQGGRVVRSMLAGAEPIALRCAAAVVDLEHGLGKVRTLVVDTERTRTAGSGTIDLANRSFDLVLTPEAKQPGLFILDRSIHLHGPLHEPRHELVARVAAPSASARSCRGDRP